MLRHAHPAEGAFTASSGLRGDLPRCTSRLLRLAAAPKHAKLHKQAATVTALRKRCRICSSIQPLLLISSDASMRKSRRRLHARARARHPHLDERKVNQEDWKASLIHQTHQRLRSLTTSSQRSRHTHNISVTRERSLLVEKGGEGNGSLPVCDPQQQSRTAGARFERASDHAKPATFARGAVRPNAVLVSETAHTTLREIKQGHL